MSKGFLTRLGAKAKKYIWIPVLGFAAKLCEHHILSWVDHELTKQIGPPMTALLQAIHAVVAWCISRPVEFFLVLAAFYCIVIFTLAIRRDSKHSEKSNVSTESLATSDATGEMFQLLMATWGTDPPKTEVTQIVQGIISTGKSSVEATTKVFGDPAYGHRKMLLITYSIGTGMVTVRVQEGETCDLPIHGRTVLPPQHTPIRPPNPDQLLQVSVSRRKTTRDDGGADYYSCEVCVKNMSTVVLQNVGVKLTSWNPVPSDPHKGTTEGTIDKQTRIPLPMPVDFPIAIKPESQTGRTINPGDSSIFRLFKMIRTGGNQWGEGITTVEIVGAEQQYHWFRPPKWCTVELECSSSVGVVRRQYQITFETDEKKIASFTVV